jgi:hypothetical protein
MGQKQVAFEKTKHKQETLAFGDISPRWAKRLEVHCNNFIPLFAWESTIGRLVLFFGVFF